MSGSPSSVVSGQWSERARRNACTCFGLFPVLTAVLCLSLLLFCTGCPIAGAALAKAIPPIASARYVPAKEPMLVMAESYQRTADALETEELVRLVSDDLAKHEVAPQIDPIRAIDMRSSDPAGWRKKSITQIGRETGAAQVLYIDVVENAFEQTTASEYVHGQMAVKVRIVDVATGETRWPADAADGYPMDVQTPTVRATDSSSESAVHQTVQQTMAEQIAKLFYSHIADD
jgi:hypothetical protein